MSSMKNACHTSKTKQGQEEALQKEENKTRLSGMYLVKMLCNKDKTVQW